MLGFHRTERGWEHTTDTMERSGRLPVIVSGWIALPFDRHSWRRRILSHVINTNRASIFHD